MSLTVVLTHHAIELALLSYHMKRVIPNFILHRHALKEVESMGEQLWKVDFGDIQCHQSCRKEFTQKHI